MTSPYLLVLLLSYVTSVPMSCLREPCSGELHAHGDDTHEALRVLWTGANGHGRTRQYDLISFDV